MLNKWFEAALWKRVLLMLVLGIATGFAVGEDIVAIKWIGDLFIRLIKMLVVPLIFFSLVAGVAAIGDLRKLGSVGGRAMGLFMLTALISAECNVAPEQQSLFQLVVSAHLRSSRWL